MIGAPLNMLDVGVILIVALSTLVAFFRGFIRELLSLGAWIGAAIITIYFLPVSTEIMKHHMRNEQWAAGIGALATYLVALMLISIFNSIIIRYVKTGSDVGLLDNFLGLLFGAIRGAFVVSLGYLIVSASGFIPKGNEPDWLKTAFTRPYLQMGADTLTQVAPQYLSEMEGIVKHEADDVQKEKDNTETGYKPDNLKELDRLIDSTKQPATAPSQSDPSQSKGSSF